MRLNGDMRQIAVRTVLTLLLLSGTVAWGQGSIGTIVFARGETDVEPVDPGDSFPAGIGEVYAFIEFKNLEAADVVSTTWYQGAESFASQATTLSQLLGASGSVPTGKIYFSVVFESGAQPGVYRLDVSLNAQVVQRREFTIEPVSAQGEAGDGSSAAANDGQHGATEPSEPTENSTPVAAGQAPIDPADGDVTPGPERLLFSDEFDDSSSGWGTAASESGVIEYRDSRLMFTLNGQNAPAVSVHNGIFVDTIVEVEATTIGGPVDNALGIVVRYQDNGNYYAFLVSADGYYAIVHFIDGEPVWDQEWEFDGPPGVQMGMTSNQLRVLAQGPLLRFYVNGALRGVVQDALWQEGQIGVFAGVFDEPGVRVGFDNWRVWSLPQQ